MISQVLKRKRSSNWTESEKELLVGLCKPRSMVLNDKTVDTNTNLAKKRAWNDVLKSFNHLTSDVPRTVSQVKVQWKAMKSGAKKRLSNHNAEVRNTVGGGKPPNPLPNNYKSIEMKHKEFVLDDDSVQEVIMEAPIAELINEDAIIILEATSTPEPPLEPEVSATAAHVWPNTMDQKKPKKRTFEQHLKEKLLVATLKSHEDDNRRRELEHRQTMRHREEYHNLRVQHQTEEHAAAMRFYSKE